MEASLRRSVVCVLYLLVIRPFPSYGDTNNDADSSAPKVPVSNNSLYGPYTTPGPFFISTILHGLNTVSSSHTKYEVDANILPFVRTSAMSGHVTFHKCDKFKPDLCERNAFYTVVLPDDHLALISFPVFDLRWQWYAKADGYVELLHVHKDGAFSVIWRYSTPQAIAPRLYNTSVMIQVALPFDDYLVRGFKMVYTIHPVSQTPPEVAEGVFNCSVPFYHTFKEHFHCNLVPECPGGEDEGGHCPFSSPACQGNFAVGNKCYHFFTANHTLRWTQARRQCQRLGGDLIMMKTLEEWDAFTNLLRTVNALDPVYVGMQSYQPSMPRMYRNSFTWVDHTVNYHVSTRTRIYKTFYDQICSFYMHTDNRHFKNWLFYVSCQTSFFKQFVCQVEVYNITTNTNVSVSFPQLNETTAILHTTTQSLVPCPGGHVSHDFLSCDSESHCGTSDYVSDCKRFGNTTVQQSDAIYMFRCDDDEQTIHYTLVCDFRRDCSDGSDETFCFHSYPCYDFQCKSGQCIPKKKHCDVVHDCWDASDEICSSYYFTRPSMTHRKAPPAIIDFHSNDTFTQAEISGCESCPQTHFCCPEAYCIPVYCRCNGVADCTGKEDETECDNFQCPGFYRCRASSVCVHAEHLCDGWPQCPQHDDEWLCKTACPEGCMCQGHAFRCPKYSSVPALPELRYLDAGGSGLQLYNMTLQLYLVWLSLSRCGVENVSPVIIPNLQMLDLSHNKITSLLLDVFVSLKQLRVLDLSHNPLVSVVSEMSEIKHSNLLSVDFSDNLMTRFNGTILVNCPTLQKLNLSHSAITEISDSGFKSTPNLVHIDLRGSLVDKYPSDVFKSLDILQIIQADNYKLCCKELLPEDFDEKNCFAPVDEISSCADLLRSDTYRAFLWLLSVLSVIGNMGCLITRVFLLKGKSLTAFSIFVTNLSIADLFMGVYLALVGAADHNYRGKYFWFEETWKPSFPCQLAGFLSLLSSETSAFIICLITLDRFLVLSSPFSQLRFKRKTASCACLLVWLFGLCLAVVPLLPMTSEWEFYSQTGICIPLPITRKSFKGRNYAFGIIIIFNLVLFLLIATGQAMIYWTIRTTSMATSSTKKTKDLTIARRLLSVVLSDFLCWFPIGLLGLMAANGTPIPGEVNVGMAIFVLPLNAALNPFLYTFNSLMERWKKREEQLLLKFLQARKLDPQDN